MPLMIDWPRHLLRRARVALAEYTLGSVARASRLWPDAHSASVLRDLQRQPMQWGTSRPFKGLSNNFATRTETPC
jgi:hypothetical protein